MMSFDRYLNDLKAMEAELSKLQAKQNSNQMYAHSTFDDSRLDELLIDLTDYSKSHGNGSLTSKLLGLQRDSNTTQTMSISAISETRARVLRIIRVLETFGSNFLAASRIEQSVPLEKDSEKIPAKSVKKSQDVFVVHGHDNAVLFRVKETLLALGLKPMVLREQANGGKTVIEKFEHYSNVGFAVVLMTADDMGGSLAEFQEDNAQPRARQNVVLELGFFAAKLTREGICVLKADGVDPPSDIMGLVYTSIDAAEAWRLKLAQELKNAGYEIDMNLLV